MQETPQTNVPPKTPEAKFGATMSMWQSLLDFRVWLIAALFLLMGFLSLNDTMLYTPDSPRYLLWAKSLASFEGFRDASGPDPSYYVIHAPFYSILLAPLAWFFTNIILPAKVLTLFSGLILILLFYAWSASKAGKPAALVGAFFLAVNPLLLLFSTHVLSDVPFAVFVLLFFMLAETMVERPDEERWNWLFVIALTIGILVREVGLTLLLAAFFYLLIRNDRRRLLLVFTIPMLFYMIWYFRNEVYVAGIEDPSIRNVKMLLGHSFTGENASLFDEFVARMRINLAVYLNAAKGLILFPQYLIRIFPVVLSTDPMIAGINATLRWAQYPLILLQYGLFAWGVFLNIRDRKTTLLLALFAFFYLIMILLYPINDIRFLVPLMVMVLFYAVLGGKDLMSRVKTSGRVASIMTILTLVVVLFLAIPNLAWDYNYDAHNRAYLHQLNDQSKPFVVESPTPELYVRPMSLVGKWLSQQPDSATTVLTRWKELSFWLGGRKILDYDPLLSLTLFENFMRDYNVGYIVAHVVEPGIREFEFQMLQSRRFGFASVYRAGSIEVIKVYHLYRHVPGETEGIVPGVIRSMPGISQSEQTARELFRQGVQMLETSRYDEAVKVFRFLFNVSHGSGDMALFGAIALECSGRYRDANTLYNRFRYQPQAGTYIKHAWHHQLLIQRMEAAAVDTSKSEKAMSYHKVSISYWDLGFHRRAFEVLQLALKADSNFTPGLIFGMYYSIEMGDTVGARWYFSRTQLADSNHIMNKPVRLIFALMDSVRRAKTAPEKIRYELNLAKAYGAIGLRDLTIDQSLAVLQQDPNNVDALVILAQSYDMKERQWPAIQVLKRLVALRPDDKLARERLDELRDGL